MRLNSVKETHHIQSTEYEYVPSYITSMGYIKFILMYIQVYECVEIALSLSLSPSSTSDPSV